MINVLVADDEPLARQAVSRLLRQQDDIGHVFEAADGEQALALYMNEKPPLAFLDIDMAGMMGIELAEQIGPDCVTVFVTAHQGYAINAFELNAIDYLLKPFDDDRFAAALGRARLKLQSRPMTDYGCVKRTISRLSAMPSPQYKSRLMIRDPGRIRLVDVDEVDLVVGAGNYAELHLLDGRSVLHRETMTSLERQLDPRVFVRIHRSYIVRRTSISELRPNEKGDYSVLLKRGQQITLSRRNRHILDELVI